MRHIKKLIPNDRALFYLRGCNPFQFADRVTKLVGDCLDQINEFYNVLSTVEDGKDGKDGEQGPMGPVGPTGPMGPVGPKGNDGIGVPSGGNVGQYLKKKSNSNYDTEWSDVQGGGGGNVESVNGQTGVVVLDATDVGALPSDTPLFSGDYNDLDNKPTIPSALSQLNEDASHRVVTDVEKTTWNNKSNFSGSYNDLTNKPTIPAAQIQSDWNQTNNSSKDFIKNKPTIPTVPTNVSAFTNDAGYLTQHQSLDNYVQKSQTTGLIKNDGAIDTNTYLTQHQDISGKANKSEMSVTDGTGANSDKTIIQLKSNTSATVLKSHQSLSGKQDVIDTQHKLSADLVDDTNSTNKFTNATEKQTWNSKQNALVSGTNIKTINNESILGGGNISVAAELPSNLAYTSNDDGEGIIPSDGIRAVTITSAAAMTVNPDVVTVINGAVGTAAITLQVPQDNLAHVWDILMTTDSTVAITFAMSNSATILYPNGFSVGASKAVEVSVIGVGTKYYLRYGEFA